MIGNFMYPTLFSFQKKEKRKICKFKVVFFYNFYESFDFYFKIFFKDSASSYFVSNVFTNNNKGGHFEPPPPPLPITKQRSLFPKVRQKK